MTSRRHGQVSRYLWEMRKTSGAAGAVSLAFQTRATGGVFLTKRALEISTSLSPPLNLSSFNLAPGTDYRVRIKDVTDNNTTISEALNFTKVDVDET